MPESHSNTIYFFFIFFIHEIIDLQGKVNVDNFFLGDESYKDYMSLHEFDWLATIDDKWSEICRKYHIEKKQENDVLRKR